LIKTSLIAEACHPGSGQDLADCDYISREWPVEDFQTSQAVGRVLPYNVTCPPVNYKAGDKPTATCILGINPVHAVNVTCQADIKATLEFAQKHNVRLVTTGTGHDPLGRSDGYGSLQVWLRRRSRPGSISSLLVDIQHSDTATRSPTRTHTRHRTDATHPHGKAVPCTLTASINGEM
jgi:hypothetical protein